jgi:hypothetical protein
VNAGRLLVALAILGIVHSPLRAASPPAPPPVISLAGTWQVKLDPQDKGLAAGWRRAWPMASLHLPGSTDEAKMGEPVPDPHDYAMLSRRYRHVGPAWYVRKVTVPASWRGRRLSLFLERTHWESRAWWDGRPLGMRDSLCVPHEHAVGPATPGVHTICLRVDNRHKYNLGPDPHSVSEQTQTNWNGIIGRIELRALPAVQVAAVQAYPDAAKRSVRLVATLEGATARPVTVRWNVAAEGGGPNRSAATSVAAFQGTRLVDTVIELGRNAPLWDEFSPRLHRATVTVSAGGVSQSRRIAFGLRDLAVRQKRILINGRPIFLRGTLECCVFPLTGYPPMDVNGWLRVIRVAKSYGLNHLRFHSWCPPEAAFEAADREGFYLHVEAPQWVHNVGRDAPRDAFIQAEARRIADAYGNHPSFLILCMGNELLGDTKFLSRLVAEAKKRDGRHLVTSSTAWSAVPENDVNVVTVRGLHGATADRDFRDRIAVQPAPTISHEVGQWTVFPNIAEIRKYTGVTRPYNLERLRDDLREKGLLGKAAAFTQASGRLSAELYKEEMEVLLRTPGHSGYQLLDLHDFPGQGTAHVGILDAFWGSKGLCAPEWFRQFAAPTVPLLRLPKREYVTTETLTAPVEVSHHGPKSLSSVAVFWKAETDNGPAVGGGRWTVPALKTGSLTQAGTLSLPLSKVKAPARLTVTISAPAAGARNSWHVWVYPPAEQVAPPPNVAVARTLEEALSSLREGRRVLLLASRFQRGMSRPGAFTTVFWSPVWFAGYQQGTMGILCDPKHPALAGFPTESHSDWQWADIARQSRPMVMDRLPRDFEPIVAVIDNFVRNQRLGIVAEARVGEGRLLMTSINLWDDMEKRPAARAMWKSLLDYAGSDAFAPKQELTEADLRTFLSDNPDSASARGAKVLYVDSEQADETPSANAIDGDESTIWHTEYQARQPDYPHEIVLDYGAGRDIAGFRYLPRQSQPNGRFTQYAFYAGDDPKAWGEPLATGTFPNDTSEQVVMLASPVRARYIRLVGLKGANNRPWMSVAELDIIPAEGPAAK